jgi:uncharacterized protein (DUF433 family)
MPATTEMMIRKTPGVMGGEACIRMTRISVWILVGYQQLGLSDPELLEAYPTLNQEDLDAAWEYYAANREEVDEAIRLNEED